jgi:hypothetical protein
MPLLGNVAYANHAANTYSEPPCTQTSLPARTICVEHVRYSNLNAPLPTYLCAPEQHLADRNARVAQLQLPALPKLFRQGNPRGGQAFLNDDGRVPFFLHHVPGELNRFHRLCRMPFKGGVRQSQFVANIFNRKPATSTGADSSRCLFCPMHKVAAPVRSTESVRKSGLSFRLMIFPPG